MRRDAGNGLARMLMLCVDVSDGLHVRLLVYLYVCMLCMFACLRVMCACRSPVRSDHSVDAVDKIKQLSLAPLLAETIKRVYLQRSLSSLFDDDVRAAKDRKQVDSKASDLTSNMTLAAPKKKEMSSAQTAAIPV